MFCGTVFDEAANILFAAGIAQDVCTFADIGSKDGSALAAEQLDGRFPDPRRRAGDDRDLACKPLHWWYIASVERN